MIEIFSISGVNMNAYGKGRENIPNFFFRIMSSIFKVRDTFSPIDDRIDNVGIKEGDTVIDYGCGPGSYIKKASTLIGDSGTLYAIDIHPMAIKAVEKKINKYKLNNVKTNSCKWIFMFFK